MPRFKTPATEALAIMRYALCIFIPFKINHLNCYRLNPLIHKGKTAQNSRKIFRI